MVAPPCLPVTSAPAPATSTEADARFARIDVLRAGAASMVVVYHFFGSKFGWHLPWLENGFADLSAPLGTTAPRFALSFGWASVPLFFALSGFCIHGAFVRQPRFKTGAFFWRRFWRIYPPFLAAMAVFCFWPIHHLGTNVSPMDVANHLTTAFVLTPGGFWSDINPSFWSVAVEFQCYLLYPLFLYLRSRWGTARVAFTWFALATIGKIIACSLTSWPDHAINFWSCTTLFSFGDWALGALVAEDIATRTHRGFYRRRVLLAVTAACALSTLWRPSLTLSFSLAAIIGALLIILYANRPTPLSLPETLLARIGIVSYSLYLWHQPLLGPLEVFGRDFLGSIPLWLARIGTLAIIATSLGLISFISYYLIEQPGIALGRRLIRARFSPPRTPPAASTV